MRWQVQEAKQRFSELLRAAETGEPQIVTRHGEEIAVVMDMTEYRRLTGDNRTALVEFLLKLTHIQNNNMMIIIADNP